MNYVEADVVESGDRVEQIEITESSTSTIEQFDVVQSTQPEQATS